MRNFQDFINKKIAVEATDDFMKLCEDNGLLWSTGELPFSRIGKLKFRFVTLNGRGNGRLTGEDYPDYFKEIGLKIVPASEFLTQSTTIEIFQSKQTIVCLKKQDGKVVAVGKAKCNPEDAFDFEFGATLAFQRMIGTEPLKPPFDISDYEQGIKTLKNGMKIRKQDRYEVGDKVKFFKKIDGRKQLHSGEVGEVIKTRGGHYELKFNGGVDTYFYGSFRIKGKVIS